MAAAFDPQSIEIPDIIIVIEIGEERAFIECKSLSSLTIY
jgi:hypothetical protein